MAEYIESGWGKLRFYQLKKGYKFAIDTVLLAAFVEFKKNAKILEAGSGEGIIPVLLKLKGKPFSYTGIEVQPELAFLARKNLKLNNISGEIIIGDWKDLKIIEPEKYDIGIVNPPYYRVGTGKRNPDPIEEIARHEVRGDIESAIRFLSRGLKKRSKLYLIYPASRIETLIKTLLKYNIHPKRILPVYSTTKGEAKFLLCEGVKSGGEEVKLLQPLYIFEDPHQKIYTAEMQEIMDTMKITSK